MADLIDRQAALKAIQDLYPTMPRINFGDNISNWQQKYRQYIECEKVIRILPSADVQPVRHGYWIPYECQRQYDVDNGNYLYVCSKCKHSDLHARTVDVPYCWHCGAKMDEVT